MDTRPENLPDFESPPLDEVVIGVQFTPVPNFKTLDTVKVWDLFRDGFPLLEEVPALAPQFETFGGIRSSQGIQFSVAPGAVPTRFWFISQDQGHLIQFQNDRLLLNWRKRSTSGEYPRFEHIFNSFSSYLEQLEELFLNEFKSKLEITQAEVSYINLIPVQHFDELTRWIKFLGIDGIDVESASSNFAEAVSDSKGKAIARMYHELQSVSSYDGKQKAFRLSITCRGVPYDAESNSDKLELIKKGRIKIIHRFVDLTTEYAHEQWGRKQ